MITFFSFGGKEIKLLAGYTTTGILILRYAFGIKKQKVLLRKAIPYYLLTSVLLGGSLALIKKMVRIWTGKTTTFTDSTVGVIILSFVMSFAFRWLLKRIYTRKEKTICKVFLGCDGMQLTLTALVDTGNSLVEPISRKPVSIVEENIFPKEITFSPGRYRAIPYHAVGTKNGILSGYEMEYLKIENGEKEITIEKPMIGISGLPVSGNHAYQMILHPKLLMESEE